MWVESVERAEPKKDKSMPCQCHVIASRWPWERRTRIAGVPGTQGRKIDFFVTRHSDVDRCSHPV